MDRNIQRYSDQRVSPRVLQLQPQAKRPRSALYNHIVHSLLQPVKIDRGENAAERQAQSRAGGVEEESAKRGDQSQNQTRPVETTLERAKIRRHRELVSRS